MRVLIAEDREVERRALRRAVEGLGHECLAAADGVEAWETFLARGADVVISDWVMPGIEGPELCRRVRGHTGVPYTYVILLTVLDDPAHTLAGMEAGADDYLTKPLEVHKLAGCLVAAARVTALHRHVWQREAQREQTLAQLEALLRVARQSAAAGDAERLLTELLSEAVVLLGGTAGVVSRWDPVRGAQVPIRSTLPGALAAARDPMAIEVGRLSSQAAAQRSPVIHNGQQPAVVVPLLDQEHARTLGAIAVTSHDPSKRFTADDVEILEQLARIGAAALTGLDRARVEGALVALHAQERLGPHHAGGVPRQPTPLIGRERELDLVRQLLLRSDTSLVTLTGPAGTGKTRLALEVADSLLDVFDDGVCLVDLAPVFDPVQVIPAIAHTLGIGGPSQPPLVDQLRRKLAEGRMLLVLDNFEQVLPAAADVAQLGMGCPATRVLVTSREALRVRSEREVPVPPLALPDPSQPLALPAVASSAAVALFVARAQAANPDFALTEANAAAVAETCRLLDGLPLAIELAAARSRILSPKVMPGWLEGSLAVLGGWAPDRPERHQTLRAAIAWSYDLLTDDEQHLFRQLAVFAGGFTIEAAAAVVEAGDRQSIDMLDVVAELVSKNLVSTQTRPDGEARFRLLQTVRAYALEQLVASGGRDQVQRRHAAFFVALAERAQTESRGPARTAWLERLSAEHDNLRTTVRWCAASGDCETELRLVGSLAWFWEAGGYLTEGREALDAALARAGATPTLSRARAHAAAGRLALAAGDLATARAQLETSLPVWRQAGDKVQFAMVLASLARVRHRQGSSLAGRSLAQESLAVLRPLGDKWAIADALEAAGEIAATAGNRDAAWRFYWRSLAIWHELGDRWRLAHGFEAVACLAAECRQAKAALRLASAAAALRVAIARPLGSTAQAQLDQTLAPCRQVLGEAASAAAWAEGRSLPLERLVAGAAAEGLRQGAPPVRALGGEAASLTERQRSVAVLVALGFTNRQIGEELQLSERTVETHVRHMLHKLTLVSRTQLAAWVVEQRLVSEPAA